MSFTVEQIQQCQALLTKLEMDWAKAKPIVSGWKAQLSFNQAWLDVATNFVFAGIDQFVQLVGQFTVPGSEKKALVIKYANMLYELVNKAVVPVIFQGGVLLVEPMFDAMLDAAIELAYRKLVATNPAPVVH